MAELEPPHRFLVPVSDYSRFQLPTSILLIVRHTLLAPFSPI